MRIVFLFIISFSCLQLYAQRNCGTADYWQNELNKDQSLSLRRQRIDFFSAMQSAASLKNQDGGIADVRIITIPVVIHVLYNNSTQNIGDAQINSQISILNKDYNKLNDDISLIPAPFNQVTASCQIKFELAKVDPEGRSTTGIIRKKTDQVSWLQNDKMKFSISGGDDAWDCRSYLNIWVCNLTGSLLGYSTFPGASPEKDGVVIRSDLFGANSKSSSPYNKGRTATHEIGHWLNLAHLWGDTDCGDDKVDDTPQQKTYSSGCPSFPKITGGGCNTNPAGDMFMNFMDFTDDACMHMFTIGQRQRMRDLFEASGSRESILHSSALGNAWNTTAQPGTSVETQIFSLYPNPAVTDVTFSTNTGKIIIPQSYTVYDAAGRPVISGNNRSTISVYRLTVGIYTVKLQWGDQSSVIKFIKQ